MANFFPYYSDIQISVAVAGTQNPMFSLNSYQAFVTLLKTYT